MAFLGFSSIISQLRFLDWVEPQHVRVMTSQSYSGLITSFGSQYKLTLFNYFYTPTEAILDIIRPTGV